MVTATACIHSLYYHTYHSTLQQACIHGCCDCMHSFCTITHTIPHYNKHVFMVAATACIHSVLSHIPFHTTTIMYSWLLRLHAFILYYHTYHSTLQQACIHGCCGCMHSFCTITHTIPHYNKHVFMVAAIACIHSVLSHIPFHTTTSMYSWLLWLHAFILYYHTYHSTLQQACIHGCCDCMHSFCTITHTIPHYNKHVFMVAATACIHSVLSHIPFHTTTSMYSWLLRLHAFILYYHTYHSTLQQACIHGCCDCMHSFCTITHTIPHYNKHVFMVAATACIHSVLSHIPFHTTTSMYSWLLRLHAFILYYHTYHSSLQQACIHGCCDCMHSFCTITHTIPHYNKHVFMVAATACIHSVLSHIPFHTITIMYSWLLRLHAFILYYHTYHSTLQQACIHGCCDCMHSFCTITHTIPHYNKHVFMVAATACIHSVLSHIPFHTTTSMYSWLLRLHAFILYYHTYHSTQQQACIHGCCGCMHSFCTITHTIPHYNNHVFMVAATACIHSVLIIIIIIIINSYKAHFQTAQCAMHLWK